MKKETFLETTESYFEGALDMMDDDDLPDGAWFQVLIDTATHLLKSIKEDTDLKVPLPDNIDGHDIVMHWIENKDAQQNEPE